MSIDIAIVCSFLLITLVVGIGSSGKIKTIQDYALGGRNFSTGALVATIVATYASASGFFIDLNMSYNDGLFYIFAALFGTVSMLITAYILAPRMGEFLGSTSVAEVMGNLYGKEARIITAIAGTIGAAGFIAVQFKAFGNVAAYFTGISPAQSVIIAGTIVTLYSALGGIKAVTTTDILQFFTFGFVIPLIGIMIWNNIYTDNQSVEHILQAPNFQLSELTNTQNEKFWPMIFLIFYFIFPVLSPAIYQRILIGKDVSQVKKSFIISAIIYTIVFLSTSWISFLVLGVNDHLESSQVLGFIIDNYTYVGLKGLIIIGVIAMAMSTADSHLNISSVLFSHDICGPLKIWNNKQLVVSKWFSFFLGALSIMLALSAQDLLSIILFVNSFYMPIVTVPLLLTILGFRSTRLAVLIAMGAAFASVVIWKMLSIPTNPLFFSMGVNLLFLMGTHYLLKQEGGWVGIKDKQSYQQLVNTEIKEKTKRIDALRNFNFVAYCKKTFPNNDVSYTGLGIYFIIFTVTTMYSTHSELLSGNRQMVLFMYQIMMITGIVLAMYPIWPMSIKHELKETIVQIAWPVTIFYMLVVFNFFFMLISNFGLLQFSVFSINLVITSILLGWRLASVMMLFGILIAGGLYTNFFSHYEVDFSIGSPGFVSTYSLMLVATTLVIFIKPKQEYIEATERKVCTLETEVTHLDHEVTNLNEKAANLGHEVNTLHEQVAHYSERTRDQEQEIERLGATAQKILNNVNHELRLPIGNVVNFSDMLHEALQKSDNKYIQELSEEVYKNSNRISSMILNMLDLATLDVKKIDLQKKMVNFSELVEDRVKTCRKIYLQNKKIDFELRIDPEVMISVDPNYIRQTVDNLVINAISFSETGLIKVVVSKQKGQVIFTITDQGKGIPPAELSDIFTPFKMGSNTESKADGRGIGLALCKSAVEAHGGTIKAESDGKVGAMLRFVLPL